MVLKDLSDKNPQQFSKINFPIIRYCCVYVYEKYLIYIIVKIYHYVLSRILSYSTIKEM